MNKYGISDIELKIIKEQMKRRAKYREEFLKLRTDPYKHAQEAGHVFDDALQRYQSMKACQYEYFKPCPRTILQGIAIMLPMFIYGYLIKMQRGKFEQDIRSGKLTYKDRIKRLI